MKFPPALWTHAIILLQKSCYPVHVCAAGLYVWLRRFVCIVYNLYFYTFIMYVNKKPAAYCLTTQKSPAEYIQLLSHGVKMPSVWFVTSSKLYRQSNSYSFLLEQHEPRAPEYCIMVHRHVHAAVLEKIMYCIAIVVIVLKSYFSSVH